MACKTTGVHINLTWIGHYIAPCIRYVATVSEVLDINFSFSIQILAPKLIQQLAR